MSNGPFWLKHVWFSVLRHCQERIAARGCQSIGAPEPKRGLREKPLSASKLATPRNWQGSGPKHRPSRRIGISSQVIGDFPRAEGSAFRANSLAIVQGASSSAGPRSCQRRGAAEEASESSLRFQVTSQTSLRLWARVKSAALIQQSRVYIHR